MLRLLLSLLLVSSVVCLPGRVHAQDDDPEEAEEADSDTEGAEEADNAESDDPDEDEDEDEGDEDDPAAGSPYTPTTSADAGIRTPATICSGAIITEINVRGARRVEDADILATMRLRTGVPCRDGNIRVGARRLWRLGIFEDLRVDGEPDDEGGIALTITVQERPAIRRVRHVGNSGVNDEDIEEKINLREGEVLSIPDVRTQVTRLRDLYAEEGYFLAQIDYEIVTPEGHEGEVDVVFNIVEGEEVSVRQIRFVGNENVDSETLLGFMETSETGFFSFISDGDTFDRSKFDDDVTRLQLYYYNEGYLAMRTGAPQIELSGDRRYIDITIPIDEGPRFRIGEIRIREENADGVEIDPIGGPEAIREEIALDDGAWFNRTTIAEGIQNVTRTYRDEGYARVEIVPDTELDEETRVVDVIIQIRRGPVVYIERIEIGGNTKTRDRVIRREFLIEEGDRYSQTLLEASRNRVQALGYFERVDMGEEDAGSENLIRITVEVGERATGTFQVGAGFSSIEQFILTAQIEQQNLFGRGQTLSLNAQLSGVRQFIQARFFEPWFLNTQWSMGVDGFRTTRQFQAFNRESMGAGITFGHPIFDRRLQRQLRVSAGYRIERIDISDRTQSFGNTNALGATAFTQSSLHNRFRDGRTSSFRFGITWDSRDNRIFTRNGWFASYSAEVAESFIGSENIFVRQDAFVRFYQALVGSVVFKINTNVGLITSRADDGVPIFERYYLGGIFNIRGYGLNVLGPRVGIPTVLDPGANVSSRGFAVGGNLQAYYQMELEFPILESAGIRGVVFHDAGNAWNLEPTFCQAPETADADPTSAPCGFGGIRTSIGFGLRWFSPLGPLRFEWGFPLARREGEDRSRFEFTIGQSF